MSALIRSLMLGACLAVVATPAAAQGRWSFSAGADYTTGDYGEAEDTDILIVPFAAAYRSERWGVQLTVPYVRLEGTGNIVPGSVGGGAGAPAPGGGGLLGGGLLGGGGLVGGLLGGSPPVAAPPPPTPGPAPTPTRIEEEGLGDVTLSLAATPFIADSGARFTLVSDVRFPTADEERSLGAGETIAALGGVYRHPLGDRTSVHAALGYQHAFETEASGGFAGLGAQSDIASGFTLGGSVDWAEATFEGRRDQTTATLYAGFDAGANTRVIVYGLGGLSESSPNAGAGLRLIVTP